MIRKYFLGSAMAITILTGSIFADIGHGTHTPGTIAAIPNNSTAIGGGGRDILIGGLGDDYLNVATQFLAAGVQYLLQAR